MTVSSMELRNVSHSVSTFTWSTWAPHDASGTGNWRIALPKFAGGSMRVQDDDGLSGETQDPIVDARLDFLYRDACAMEKLDEVDEALH